MRWASASSDLPDLGDAIGAAVSVLREQLGGEAPDLLVAFTTPHHESSWDLVPSLLEEPFPEAVLVGCSAGGVIGGGEEIEHRPGVALSAAVLPGVELRPFHLESAGVPGPEAELEAWTRALGVRPDEDPSFVLLPDPFTFDSESFVRDLDTFFPDAVKVGGLASGGRSAGTNALYLGGRVHRSGMVGLVLSGNVQVETIVAQGCRPIGSPMFVTRSTNNLLYELDGRAAGEVLQELYDSLDESDQLLFQTSLFLGLVMEVGREIYVHGDFLVRNILGIEPESGALAIGALLDTNQVVQFHLRDARTSAQDLAALLDRYDREGGGVRPIGSLLFSCLGRGSFLYGRPNHDIDLFRDRLGPTPIGGFFCNGEIGPVHGATFLHGYTSSFGLFRPKTDA